MKHNIFLIVFSIVIINPTVAQLDLGDYFNKIEKGKKEILKKEEMTSLYQNENSITQLHEFLKKENPKVKREAIRLIGQVGRKNTYPKTRQQAVNILLMTAMDKEAGVSGSIPSKLKRFKKQDFTLESRRLLGSIIRGGKASKMDQYIMLAGFIRNCSAVEQSLFQYKSHKRNYQAVKLAQVRCGDKARLNNLMKNIKKMPVDDKFVYRVMPLLIYVRQKEATDYLMDWVMSDKKGCTPAGPDVPGRIPCAYRIIEALAPVVKDFPVKVDPLTGEMDVGDYTEGLKIVRNWIRKNKNSYTLIKDVY